MMHLTKKHKAMLKKKMMIDEDEDEMDMTRKKEKINRTKNSFFNDKEVRQAR